VTSRTSRRLALGALAVALTLPLSSCGSTSPGAAAVLAGAEDISTRVLQEQVELRLQAEGGEAQEQAAELQRQVLSQLLRSRLLERIAEDEDITVTEGEVDESLLRLAGGADDLDAAYAVAEEQAGLDRATARRLGRDEALRLAVGRALSGRSEVPEEELRAAYEESIGEFDTVTVKIIAFEDPAPAQATLTELQADPERFDEIAQERSLDAQSAGQEIEVARGASPPEIDEPLFATPPGGLTLVEEGENVFVVQVVDRETVPFEEAREQLESSILEPQSQELVAQRLAEEAEELEISVNPRFGVWDPVSLQVVADTSELSRSQDDAEFPGTEPLLPQVPGAPGAPGEDPAGP
jgi:hypothetical protein